MAQPGSASGLGPEGRRFESCLPDMIEIGKIGSASGLGPEGRRRSAAAVRILSPRRKKQKGSKPYAVKLHC